MVSSSGHDSDANVIAASLASKQFGLDQRCAN